MAEGRREVTWHTGRMAALDFETTGTDPHEAIIVTAFLGLVGGGEDTAPTDWVLSPGDFEIPEGATKIHGYTTARARAEGVDHRTGVEAIAFAVAQALTSQLPVVGHKVGQYDLTVLDAECLRWGVATVADRIGGGYYPVIDTMILSKHVDPFRKRVSPTQGAHTLRTTAETLGLGWDEKAAHGARYDAMASARAAWRIGQIAHAPHDRRPDWVRRLRTQRFDDLAGLSLADLHARQIVWAEEQAAGLQEHFRKSDPAAVVDGNWPVLVKAVSS